MEGSPFTIKPLVLKIDDQVAATLDKARLLAFFQKFNGYNESISCQIVQICNDGNFIVNGFLFSISAHLISEVSGLPLEDETIMPQIL